MLSNSKKVKKVARIISDPVANFVSLVSHAANQTPFKKIKNEGETPAVIDEVAELLLQKVAKVSPDLVIEADVSRPESNLIMMQKMEFDKANFTKKAAIARMTELGFSEYSMISEEDKWIAKSDYYEQFEDNIGTINGEVGVRLFIGQLKKTDDGEDLELEESVSETGVAIKLKSDENSVIKNMDSSVVQKFDRWAAFYSGDSDLGSAIKDGLEYDPLPFGTDELMAAFIGAVRAACREDNSNAIRQAANDMGDILVGLLEVTHRLVKSDNEGLVKMATELKKTLEGTNAEEVVTEDVVVEESNEEETAAKEEKEDVAAEEVVTEDDAQAVEVQKSTNEDLLVSIKSLLQETVDSLKEENAKTAKKMEERLEKLEGVSVQKRSQSATEEEVKKVEKAVEQEEVTVFKVDSKIADIMGL